MSDSLSPSERYALLQTLNALPPSTFEALRFSVGAPHDVISGDTAPQGSRGVAFLEWAKSPVGCGLSEVIEMLDRIAPGAFRALSSPQAAAILPTPEATPKQDAQQNLQEGLGGGVILDMIYIPGGRFWMGSPENEDGRYHTEGPQHKVQVPSFYMGKYPITQVQWRAVSLLDDVSQELKPNPSRFLGDQLPVECVNWHEAVEFCARLSKHTGRKYRLPGEAEWEYACRAGAATPFYTGEKLLREKASFRSSCEGTTRVGRFPPNSFELHDMHGNVWEWCQDHWHSHL